MRVEIVGSIALAAMLLFPIDSGAQSADVNFAHGVDYTFERMQAVRPTEDEGEISLVTYVYRPVKKSNGQVAIYNHGSTGGWTSSPKEPFNPQRSLIEFLIRRGFTVVVPLRRGFGESSGSYREECEFQAHKCTLADNRLLQASALQEAFKDIDAVIDQVVMARLAPAKSGVLFVGQSRGGFVSLYYATQRPELIKGVINFVPGLVSVSNNWPTEENVARLQLYQNIVSRAGAVLKVPTLWIYAARDRSYEATDTQQWFNAFIAAGGKGEYFFISDHSLENGHFVINSPAHWEAAADRYLSLLH